MVPSYSMRMLSRFGEASGPALNHAHILSFIFFALLSRSSRTSTSSKSPAHASTIHPEKVRGSQANVVADEEDPNESRYLGQNSIAAFLSEETTAG